MWYHDGLVCGVDWDGHCSRHQNYERGRLGPGEVGVNLATGEMLRMRLEQA